MRNNQDTFRLNFPGAFDKIRDHLCLFQGNIGTGLRDGLPAEDRRLKTAETVLDSLCLPDPDTFTLYGYSVYIRQLGVNLDVIQHLFQPGIARHREPGLPGMAPFHPDQHRVIKLVNFKGNFIAVHQCLLSKFRQVHIR